tara:strand:- start:673 stop:876 length:204 start_codon:yes stop_codon:yes gene_type:complete
MKRRTFFKVLAFLPFVPKPEPEPEVTAAKIITEVTDLDTEVFDFSVENCHPDSIMGHLLRHSGPGCD